MSRLHNILRALSLHPFMMLITCIAPLTILLIKYTVPPGSVSKQGEAIITIYSNPVFWIITVIAAIGLILIFLQTWSNYWQRWYDPALALKYMDIFFENSINRRSRAAKVYKDTGKWDSNVEDVLDILDDLGFHVKTLNMSPEVAHFYFYYWIRGYIQTADEYIRQYRSKPRQQLAYEYCHFLLEEVSKVEAKKMNASTTSLHWNEKEIEKFIDEEIGEASSED